MIPAAASERIFVIDQSRCIGCKSCVEACGECATHRGHSMIHLEFVEPNQMMKCDMCYDRTSRELAPMCASVCPSQALWFGTREQFAATRAGVLVHDFVFGRQAVRTKVYTVAREAGALEALAGRSARPWQDDPVGLEEEVDDA